MKEVRIFQTVAVSYQPNAYRIEVQDYGPGIPPGEVERIFDEYITASLAYAARFLVFIAICP